MINRRLASALAGGTLLAAALAGTAAAATAASAAPARPAATCDAYPTTANCSFTVSGTVVTPGGTVTFTVSGVFTPGESVTVTIQSHGHRYVVGHFTADSSGTVGGTVTVPSSIQAGQADLVLTGANGQTASTPFTVAGATATAPSSGTLPFTGAEIAAMSTVGGALLIGGGVAFATGMARKRRSSTPAA